MFQVHRNIDLQVYELASSKQIIRQAVGFWLEVDENLAEGETIDYMMTGKYDRDFWVKPAVGWNLIGASSEDEECSLVNPLFDWDPQTGYDEKDDGKLTLGVGYWLFNFPPPTTPGK